ncbi:DUF6191 domain-containing protein [Actinokineospora enzanensis]|uniref:DUF6191 domain-containing protein n=1 Tax=Actinokineospora enzanensis TaxID=155975 RepID=UPI00036AF044|nr:DUF6191 domain-containing protein [Actinokineospora enzanensis]
MDTLEAVLTWSIPLSTLTVVGVGVYEMRRQKRRNKHGTPVTATYINEFTAMFYGTKRVELDHRDSTSLLREEDAQGAPPGSDPAQGVIYVRRPPTD